MQNKRFVFWIHCFKTEAWNRNKWVEVKKKVEVRLWNWKVYYVINNPNFCERCSVCNLKCHGSPFSLNGPERQVQYMEKTPKNASTHSHILPEDWGVLRIPVGKGIYLKILTTMSEFFDSITVIYYKSVV